MSKVRHPLSRKRIRVGEGSVDIGDKVFVYKNIKRNCWSIKRDGLVKQHANVVWLKDVTFKVSEAGRLRVLREGRKNVHAGLQGTLVEYCDGDSPEDQRIECTLEVPYHTIRYDPYDAATFIDSKDNLPPFFKACVLMVTGCSWIENGVFYTEDTIEGEMDRTEGIFYTERQGL